MVSREIAQRRCAAAGSANQRQRALAWHVHQRAPAWHVPGPGFGPQHCGGELGRKEVWVQNKDPQVKTIGDSKKPKGDIKVKWKGMKIFVTGDPRVAITI